MSIVPPGPGRELASASSILFCARWGIGDTVMSLPLLERLRSATPARVVALAAEPAIQLFQGSELVDDSCAVQRFGVRHIGSQRNPRRDEAFRGWLRRAGPFDVALDVLHAPRAVRPGVWESGVASLECDQDAQERAIASGATGVEALARGAEAGWGLPMPERPTPRLPVPPHAERQADRWLGRLCGERLLGAVPCASSPLKRWPPERFATLADELLERDGGRLLVFTGGQEEIARELVGRMRRPERAVLVPPLHLLVTASILRRCALVVGNDTGLLHVASAVGARVLGVYGPTSPRIYRPPTAKGVADSSPCAHRRISQFGTPRCCAIGRCLHGGAGCARRVRTEVVVSAARRELAAAQ